MEYLWMIAGGIIGWTSIEVVGAFCKMEMPIGLNIGLLFVGGLTGYTLFI